MGQNTRNNAKSRGYRVEGVTFIQTPEKAGFTMGEWAGGWALVCK